jgi:hypothetical protein
MKILSDVGCGLILIGIAVVCWHVGIDPVLPLVFGVFIVLDAMR